MEFCFPEIIANCLTKLNQLEQMRLMDSYRRSDIPYMITYDLVSTDDINREFIHRHMTKISNRIFNIVLDEIDKVRRSENVEKSRNKNGRRKTG